MLLVMVNIMSTWLSVLLCIICTLSGASIKYVQFFLIYKKIKGVKQERNTERLVGKTRIIRNI